MFKLKKKKKGGDERQAGSLICNGEVGGKSEQRRDKERERGLCCPRVVKSLSPPSLGLGTGSISFGLLRKHWKRRLKRSGEDKGGRRIFPRAQGHTQSFSSPLRSEMGRKSLISHNLTLCTKAHTHAALVSMRTKAGTNSHMSQTHTV